MIRIAPFLAGILLAFSVQSRADEGMWLLPLIERLNFDTMQKMGLKLTPGEIYNINTGSLKDAIVMFNNGCTAEIVSEEGLLITNHHCGYDAIQNHSTLEHNYLEDGFWAASHADEIPNPGITVTFLIRMEDVSEKILAALSDSMTESYRNSRIAILSDSIAEAATAGTRFNAAVEPFFGGNRYYLVVYEDYYDVRLVGAPPSSIGKFGRDSDNWMWPRHTGDFSLFRIYSDLQGKPALYDAENIPLKPRHSFPVSLRGIKQDDFTMVVGYPGNTQRYMTSFEVNELLSITNPNRIKIRGLRQDILRREMMADERVNIQYASKYYTSSNYWKYSIGENQGLEKMEVLARKQKEEADFEAWLAGDPLRSEQYGNALGLIKRSVEGRSRYKHALQYLTECFFSASEIIAMANKATYLYTSLKREPVNTSQVGSLLTDLKEDWYAFLAEYEPEVDRRVLPAMLKLYQQEVEEEFHPELYSQVRMKYKNNLEAYIADMFEKSIFADSQKMEDFLLHPTAKALDRDPAFQASLGALDVYRQLYLRHAMFEEEYNRGHRLYIAGLMEMQKDRLFYPDANSTLRLSYGKVSGYYPRDAVQYDYFTTLTGIMEKEDSTSWEFRVPGRLKELYRKKDFGPYGKDGQLTTCFITNNDITGGNSGSPVLDGEGNLLGLAFDGNWEGMSGNIVFEPELQRCICVDIRYVLFIMDKFAGATHLVNEMKIIR